MRGDHGAMQRRDLVGLGLGLAALAAVLTALLVFKVRVFVAGGKLMVTLGVIVLVVWLISRARQPHD
ncbi:MAG: hypothetical protein L6R48_21015 [Planctomycetes bacterium]|nr:hypothetical protein [Planctomycetota bacterium]